MVKGIFKCSITSIGNCVGNIAKSACTNKTKRQLVPVLMYNVHTYAGKVLAAYTAAATIQL